MNRAMLDRMSVDELSVYLAYIQKLKESCADVTQPMYHVVFFSYQSLSLSLSLSHWAFFFRLFACVQSVSILTDLVDMLTRETVIEAHKNMRCAGQHNLTIYDAETRTPVSNQQQQQQQRISNVYYGNESGVAVTTGEHESESGDQMDATTEFDAIPLALSLIRTHTHTHSLSLSHTHTRIQKAGPASLLPSWYHHTHDCPSIQ